jgi:DNA-binding PadR family transcriptional regulator
VAEKEGNGTTDYILKLLAEKPRTSREVQLAVGRTREHTARLMKKLHDSGLVSRDVNARPFKYNITDAGRERLQEKVAPAAV